MLIKTDNTAEMTYINKQGGGGDTLDFPVHSGLECVPLGYRQQGRLDCLTYNREGKHFSRSSVSKVQNASNRVDATQGSCKDHIQYVGQTPHRPVCNTVESSDSDVCVSVPRRPSLVGGCPESQFARNSRICLSTSYPYSKNIEENFIIKLHHNTNSPLLDETTMVPRARSVTDYPVRLPILHNLINQQRSRFLHPNIEMHGKCPQTVY